MDKPNTRPRSGAPVVANRKIAPMGRVCLAAHAITTLKLENHRELERTKLV